MKTIKVIILISTLASVLVLASCSGGGDPSPVDTFEQKLIGTWNLNSVKRDGNDVTSEFNGFEISFNEGADSFSITGGNDIIYSSGSYTLSGTNAMTLSSGGENTSVSLSLSSNERQLTFSFRNNKTIYSGGRNDGVAGDYVFVLDKQ
jgi:hypothetical protein